MGEAPRPRSPPRYPDLCGRRRLQLEVQILNREVGFLEIKIGHMLLVPVLLLPLLAEAQGAKLLQLLLLRLPRHAVLYTELHLSKGPFLQPRLLHLQPSQLQLQAGLRRPLPTAVQQLLFR
ncbi:hypothetical protein BAE44_0006846 [Dichanthelium oligosanthes]|uniref:Uncharacterized protein n=1 Tax=Dichanthelium oligosanthes TaxID=888268 RepID=A0A1E5W404_9POAL|nr:hypothetical protein BAE44_0006846 [Dichanthelium oligosanthes]